MKGDCDDIFIKVLIFRIFNVDRSRGQILDHKYE